jgi:hypothetical protein
MQSKTMPANQNPPNTSTPEEAEERADDPGRLTPAAERALAEAAARRTERHGKLAAQQAKEIQGRGGLEPTRYGDWEINGLTSDF